MHVPVHRRIGFVWKWKEESVRIDEEETENDESVEGIGVE